MKKYIIQYDDYDDLLSLLGHGVPHTNLNNVTTVIVDLTNKEHEALVGAGINIVENTPAKTLSSWPADMPSRSLNPTPPYISTYLKVDNAHLAGFSGNGVNVVLLDSGCQDANLALASPTTSRVDVGYGVTDPEAHGSKGCMVISQRYSFFSGADVRYGMAYGCNLYSLRVLDGGAAGVATGIDWAIANGGHIINISLSVGGGLESAIAAAIAAGIIVVCASGNDFSQPMAHPANIDGVIAVSAVDNTIAGMPLFGSYINDDGTPKVTIVNYGAGYYEFFVGGTSQGAFMISALLAIYKQKFPTLDTPKAINLLRRKGLQMTGYTYNVESTTTNTYLNYETGAGFVAPIN